MFCVACMIFAHGVVVKCAMALRITYRKKHMEHTNGKTCVCNGVCVFRRRIIHVVCSMYDTGISFCCKTCDSSPSHF